MADSYVMRYPAAGMNQTSPPALLVQREVAEAVNCRVHDSLLINRPGVVIHDLPELDGLSFQGACFYNPSQGQSQQIIGEDDSMLVVSASGRKFSIRITDEHPTNSKITVNEIAGTAATNPTYHMVWMAQAENYLIAQDGNSDTWIWDGKAPAYFSTGYNATEKDKSKLANGASMIAYAHGRVVQVVNGRQILVGDIIHRDGSSNASNILSMTEQVYWATGSFFSPPSALGKVLAVATLPLRNTTHGHGDLMFHCEEGIFSLDITVYPRDQWPNTAITKHVSLDAACSGFYAITLYDSDQIYLTRNGVHSLRSAAQINQVGNPQRPLSERVGNYIERDSTNYFRFASISKSVRDNRLFVTTAHQIVESSHRGGRGILVMNFRPVPNLDIQCWEGLWTFPKEAYLINQLVSGTFDARERSFAFVTGDDLKIRLMEFTRDLNQDHIISGGVDTAKNIEWQVITRADTAGDEASTKNVTNAVATFKKVIGNVAIKAYARTDQTEWVLYGEACLEGADECQYGSAPSREFRMEMGAPPQSIGNRSRWIQFLFKITGSCSFESVRIKHSVDKGGESSGNIASECVSLSPDEGNVFEFNPFSYPES